MDPSILYLFTAVLSYEVSPYSETARGFQTSAMERLASEAECRIAADALLRTYRVGNIAPGRDPDKARMECTVVKDGKPVQVIVLYSKN